MDHQRFDLAFSALRDAQSALQAEDGETALAAIQEAMRHAWPTIRPTAHDGSPPTLYPFDGLVYQLQLCVAESVDSHAAKTQTASHTDAVAALSILAALLERERSMGA